MGTNTLTTRAAGQTIIADFFNDFNLALEGDVVGRGTDGVPVSGKSLGTLAFPWGSVRANSVIINGSAIDTSAISSPVNRLVSGQVRSSSHQPAFLKPNGAANSLSIEGATTSLVFDVNGTAVTLSANLSKTGLTVGPSSNHTALVNDATAAGQEATRTWGEYGSPSDITIGTVGSNISALVGKYAAFKIVSGGSTEYFLAYVESATKLSRALRGYFYDSTYAPKNRIKFSNGDTITLMSLGWVFLEDNATTVDVSYTNPSWSFVAPSGPATGDYWYDLGNQTWKRYDGASFVIIDRTFLGQVVLDSSNAVAARSWDFYHLFKDDNSVDLFLNSITQVKSTGVYQRVNVYGSDINFGKSLQTWDITANLATSADMYNGSEQPSTKYYLYVKDTGAVAISDISPHYRGDLLGYYHPHNPWRWVGTANNNSGSDLDNVVSAQVPVLNRYSAVVAARPIPGVTTHTTLTLALADISAGQEILYLGGTITENLSINKQCKLSGQGKNAVISGTLTFTSGSVESTVTGIRVTGAITLNSGANGNTMVECFQATGQTVTDNGSDNFIQIYTE